MMTLRRPLCMLTLALGLGLVADIFFYARRLDGVATPIFSMLVLFALTGISWLEQRPAGPNRWLILLVLNFALWPALRTEPLLVFLDLLALAGVWLALAVGFRSDALYLLPLQRVAKRAIATLFDLILAPLTLVVRQLSQVAWPGLRLQRLFPVLRGLLLALPVLLVFAALLSAADQIFATYLAQILTLQLPFPPEVMFQHSVFILFVACLVAGIILTALADGMQATPSLPAEGDTERLDRAGLMQLRFLGNTEALTILFLVNLLFAVFMLVQAAYLFGGLDTLAQSGLTYAEYARRGFFELLLVAFLTLGMLCFLAVTTRDESHVRRMLFRLANVLLVLLVLGILASAFQRMWLYELAYGFTRLRIYTHSFMILLAVIFLLFSVALVLIRPRIFVLGTVAAMLVYLTILNVVSPDTIIVRENIARYQADPSSLTLRGAGSVAVRATPMVDLDYLLSLSPDAMPALAQALPTFASPERAQLAQELAEYEQRLEVEYRLAGWQGWNVGRLRALLALRALDLAP
nr:DUF4173 domain-containing protein [Oscillochloris trichoides]